MGSSRQGVPPSKSQPGSDLEELRQEACEAQSLGFQNPGPEF